MFISVIFKALYNYRGADYYGLSGTMTVSYHYYGITVKGKITNIKKRNKFIANKRITIEKHQKCYTKECHD